MSCLVKNTSKRTTSRQGLSFPHTRAAQDHGAAGATGGQQLVHFGRDLGGRCPSSATGRKASMNFHMSLKFHALWHRTHCTQGGCLSQAWNHPGGRRPGTPQVQPQQASCSERHGKLQAGLGEPTGHLSWKDRPEGSDRKLLHPDRVDPWGWRQPPTLKNVSAWPRLGRRSREASAPQKVHLYSPDTGALLGRVSGAREA